MAFGQGLLCIKHFEHLQERKGDAIIHRRTSRCDDNAPLCSWMPHKRVSSAPHAMACSALTSSRLFSHLHKQHRSCVKPNASTLYDCAEAAVSPLTLQIGRSRRASSRAADSSTNPPYSPPTMWQTPPERPIITMQFLRFA